ncbi:L-lactate dehydrogenase complex protein LldG [Paenibacillus sp. LBL]|uniref:LutC/YkgG family protein n=1 Tax=Paenibacillus sp. LBL TaxID=2940563 RepID=UPI00247376D7|nr:lactate utilization protein [Paenibacillus sp. LBL]MDH6670545.1 L-lactate dehydrogenase complex protein LldG [Paenibacillus sp. LBL]
MGNHADGGWLSQLEERSRKKQELFMDGIAAKLGRDRVRSAPEHPFRGAPDFWHEFQWPLEEKITQFTANFEAAGGHAVRVSNREEVRRFIRDKALEMSAATILRQREEALDLLELEKSLPEAMILSWNKAADTDWRAVAAKADFGVVMADYAAAYTGSITVKSAPHKGRSVSLLPTVLIAVIPVDRMYTRLGEILFQFDQGGREQLPAGIHFISGPSRSADIENDLTIGVHGPGIVYAVLVDSYE